MYQAHEISHRQLSAIYKIYSLTFRTDLHNVSHRLGNAAELMTTLPDPCISAVPRLERNPSAALTRLTG
jgi:hypothetical protein